MSSDLLMESFQIFPALLVDDSQWIQILHQKSQILGKSEDSVNAKFTDPSESVGSSTLKAAK